MTQQQTQFLRTDQIQRAVEVMRAYLAAPKNPDADGRTPMEVQTERDQKRASLIEGELKPLLQDYLLGRTSLAEFKTKVD